MNKLLTIIQLSEKLSVHRTTIYIWRRKGLPTEISYGQFVRFDYEKVIDWLNKKSEGND